MPLRDTPEARRPLGRLLLPVTTAGSTKVGLPLVIGAALVIAPRRPNAAGELLASAVGALLLERVLKRVVRRERPDPARKPDDPRSSMPSGHATFDAGALTAVALLARGPAAAPTRATAAAFALLVGYSRVFFRMHHPGDVLAGWAIGAAWAAWVHRRTGRAGGTVRRSSDRLG